MVDSIKYFLQLQLIKLPVLLGFALLAIVLSGASEDMKWLILLGVPVIVIVGLVTMVALSVYWFLTYDEW